MVRCRGLGRMIRATRGYVVGNGHQFFRGQFILKNGESSASGLGIKPSCSYFIHLNFVRQTLLCHPTYLGAVCGAGKEQL